MLGKHFTVELHPLAFFTFFIGEGGLHKLLGSHRTHSVAQASLGLEIILLRSPRSKDYRPAPPAGPAQQARSLEKLPSARKRVVKQLPVVKGRGGTL